MSDIEDSESFPFNQEDAKEIRKTLIRIDERTKQRQKTIDDHDQRLSEVEQKAATNRNWIGSIKAGMAALLSIFGAGFGAIAAKVFNIL